MFALSRTQRSGWGLFVFLDSPRHSSMYVYDLTDDHQIIQGVRVIRYFSVGEMLILCRSFDIKLNGSP